MEFGVQFFPDVGPEEKSAQQYWNESLYLSELGDQLGYGGHVRTVEHNFHRYGGCSTNPVVFLAAASQRTKNMALITGAVLPIFKDRIKANVVFVGSPKNLIEQIEGYDHLCGGLDKISLQVNFHDMPVDEAEASMRLFAEEVMPHFDKETVAT